MMKKISDRSIVLTNCNMIDGNAKEPSPDTTIIINENKITSIESEKYVDLQSNANVIDASGQTVLPGLIDLHLHLLYYFNRPDVLSAQYNNPKITLVGAWHMLQLLNAGITSVRDAGSVDHLIFDLKWALREGLIRGPRIWASGRMISPTGGHGGVGINIEIDGCDAALNAVREEIKAGSDFIKLGYLENEWTLDELRVAVDQSHRMGRKVACHVNFPPSITNALNVGVDSIEHGCLVSQKELKQMLSQGTFWVVTPLIYKKQFEKFKDLVADPTTPKNLLPNAESQVKRHEWIWENMPKAILSAAEMGVKIGIGSDQLYPEVGIAALPLDMALLVELGLQPMQVIQAATSTAAECIGCKNELGTLEVGKLADLIVVNGDPLKDIHSLQKVTLVIKDGQIEKNLIS